MISRLPTVWNIERTRRRRRRKSRMSLRWAGRSWRQWSVVQTVHERLTWCLLHWRLHCRLYHPDHPPRHRQHCLHITDNARISLYCNISLTWPLTDELLGLLAATRMSLWNDVLFRLTAVASAGCATDYDKTYRQTDRRTDRYICRNRWIRDAA